MKGLQEALRDREERHSRTERRDISEEQQARNSAEFLRMERGCRAALEYYRAFHDVAAEGIITEISTPFRFLKLGEEKIFFDDIYSVRILDYPRRSR